MAGGKFSAPVPRRARRSRPPRFHDLGRDLRCERRRHRIITGISAAICIAVASPSASAPRSPPTSPGSPPFHLQSSPSDEPGEPRVTVPCCYDRPRRSGRIRESTRGRSSCRQNPRRRGVDRRGRGQSSSSARRCRGRASSTVTRWVKDPFVSFKACLASMSLRPALMKAVVPATRSQRMVSAHIASVPRRGSGGGRPRPARRLCDGNVHCEFRKEWPRRVATGPGKIWSGILAGSRPVPTLRVPGRCGTW